jgi:hypothetical protein
MYFSLEPGTEGIIGQNNSYSRVVRVKKMERVVKVEFDVRVVRDLSIH